MQSKGSLEITESQSADAEPPPPPKPDLSRYTGLRTHLSLATNEGKSSGRREKVTVCCGEDGQPRAGSQGWVAENTQRVGLGPLLWTAGTGERGCHLAVCSELNFCRWVGAGEAGVLSAFR